MDIGRRIRELREERELTQEELADRCELTKGFISLLERNRTSTSIATLEDIVQCLGVTMSAFFAEESEEQVVFNADDYFEKEDAELGNRIEWIVPTAQSNLMEPVRLTLAPGGSTYPDMPHEGEEFGFVLSGSVRVVLGDRTYRAKKGESFYYRANRRHYIKADSRTGAVLIWVSGPPSF